MQTNIQFKNKIIAFIDICGFKSLVEKTENPNAKFTLDELLKIVSKLDRKDTVKNIRINGPIVCPQSKFISKDLDLVLTQISDCVIISAEISPAGILHLLYLCNQISMGLLLNGILCRGYVNLGNIYHTEHQVIGSGYQNAYENESKVIAFKTLEDERGTPFIQIDREIEELILDDYSYDKCLQEIFSRITRSDSEVCAIFSFDLLSRSFAITGNNNLENEIIEINKNKFYIEGYKVKILEFSNNQNKKVMLKIDHYLRFLDEQIEICDKQIENIKRLNQPFLRTIEQIRGQN